MGEKEKPKVQVILEAVFEHAVEKLSNSDSGRLIGALLVQLDMSAGEVQVYDDREVLLEKNIIFDWAERTEKGTRLYKQAIHFTRVVLAALKSRKIFEHPIFARPFKVSITDDSFNEIETVFTLESAEGLSEGRLMKNLEQELQNFSKKLFAD